MENLVRNSRFERVFYSFITLSELFWTAVIAGEFSTLAGQLGEAHCVWAHLSLIHIPINDMEEYDRRLFEITLPQGFVGVGVKTGDDQERIDPKDETIPEDRFTSFMRLGTVRRFLDNVGFRKWIITLEYPSHDPEYNYGVVIMQRPG